MKKMMTIVILSFLFLACFNSQKEKNYNFIKGLNEYQKNDKVSALENYKKAYEMDKNNIVLLNEIAYLYVDLGNYEEALKYYLIIINSGELDNDIYKKTWVLSEIAYIYQNIDKYEEALEYFKKLEKIVVGDYQFYLDHAYCLIFVNHGNRT